MRTAALARLALLSWAACGGVARAQDDPLQDTTPKNYHSPQRFALEFKGGPYSSNIDATAGLTGTPFSDLFNDQTTQQKGTRPAGKPLFTVEFDWQFWHGFGSLAVGGAVGYQRRTTHSFRYVDLVGNVPCTVPNCIRSGDETALNIFPITLELVYRFDVLALKYRIPLVPYLKGGLGYYFWFIQRGDGSLAKSLDGSSKGIGGTAGLVAHPGISIMLDAIDQTAARVLDTELGINHVHVFFELNYAWITGLGFADKMVLSDTTWYTGMAFEF